MNALCPEHGYLVRRGTECRIYFGESSAEDKSSESEEANENSGSSDERRRMYSTDDNSLLLHSSMIWYSVKQCMLYVMICLDIKSFAKWRLNSQKPTPDFLLWKCGSKKLYNSAYRMRQQQKKLQT